MQKINAETFNEAKLDFEISELREGEGTPGSNASQSNECCFDSALLEQFIAMGTERVKQQFAILRSELDSAAPAPATPAHQVPGEPSGKEQPATTGAGEGWDEEQGKSAKRVCGTQRHGGSQPRFSSWC